MFFDLFWKVCLGSRLIFLPANQYDNTREIAVFILLSIDVVVVVVVFASLLSDCCIVWLCHCLCG